MCKFIVTVQAKFINHNFAKYKTNCAQSIELIDSGNCLSVVVAGPVHCLQVFRMVFDILNVNCEIVFGINHEIHHFK